MQADSDSLLDDEYGGAVASGLAVHQCSKERDLASVTPIEKTLLLVASQASTAFISYGLGVAPASRRSSQAADPNRALRLQGRD